MAKKRRPVRSTRKATSAGRPAKRKAASRKGARKAPSGASTKVPKSLNLKVLRQHIALAVSALSRRRAASPGAESKLDDTRRRLSQWMTDIDDICTPEEHEICGDSMDLPIP